MSWPFIITISLLVGIVIGQFGYGTGVMLLAAAAALWAGDALQLWINTGQVIFLIAIFSTTGAVAIAAHFLLAALRYFSSAKPSKSDPT